IGELRPRACPGDPVVQVDAAAESVGELRVVEEQCPTPRLHQAAGGNAAEDLPTPFQFLPAGDVEDAGDGGAVGLGAAAGGAEVERPIGEEAGGGGELRAG